MGSKQINKLLIQIIRRIALCIGNNLKNKNFYPKLENWYYLWKIVPTEIY